MPIAALKHRLVQAYQTQQQQQSLVAQASRAAEPSGGSDNHPHGSETKGPAEETTPPAATADHATAEQAPTSPLAGGAAPAAPEMRQPHRWVHMRWLDPLAPLPLPPAWSVHQTPPP